MTKIDELIEYADMYLKIVQDDTVSDESVLLHKIALATLRAHKQGLMICDLSFEIGAGKLINRGYMPVETDLDKILGELE